MRSLLRITLLFAVLLFTSGFGPYHHIKVAERSFDAVKDQVKIKFPQIGEKELESLRPYYLGGAIAPDLGFFPDGELKMSLLSHYLRTGDLVSTMIQISQTPEEFAFALGYRTHADSDVVAHLDSVNITVAELLHIEKENPEGVTYGYNELAHNRVESGADLFLLKEIGYTGKKDFELAFPLDRTFPGNRSIIEEAYLRVYGFKLQRSSLKNVTTNIDKYLELIPGVFAAMGYLEKKGGGPLDGLVSALNQLTIRPLFLGLMSLTKDNLGSQAVLDPYLLTENQKKRHKRATTKSVNLISTQIVEDHISIPNKNLDSGKLVELETHDPSIALFLSLEKDNPHETWKKEYIEAHAEKLSADWNRFKEAFLKGHSPQ